MSVDSTILDGRTLTESLMEATCVISRTVAGDPPVDPTTGLLNTTTDTIYTGPCRLSYKIDRPTQTEAEGQSMARSRAILSLPVIGDSADVRANDMAVITVSPVLDPGTVLNGRVEAPFAQTHATARRFPLEVLA